VKKPEPNGCGCGCYFTTRILFGFGFGWWFRMRVWVVWNSHPWAPVVIPILIMLVELVSKSLLSTIYLTSGWYDDHKKSTNAFIWERGCKLSCSRVSPALSFCFQLPPFILFTRLVTKLFLKRSPLLGHVVQTV
jgi:hypothetical protein